MLSRRLAPYKRTKSGCLLTAHNGEPNRGGYVIVTSPSRRALRTVLR